MANLSNPPPPNLDVTSSIIDQCNCGQVDGVKAQSISINPYTGRTVVSFDLNTNGNKANFGRAMHTIKQLVDNGSLVDYITHQDGVAAFNLTTSCSGTQFFAWTTCDNNPCVHGNCVQWEGGSTKCYCTDGYSGTYCDIAPTKQIDKNLLYLIIIPVVVALLALFLTACCLCARYNRMNRQIVQQPVEIIEEVMEDEPVMQPSTEIVEVIDDGRAYDDMAEFKRQLPEQTYYHAIGRTFPVAFSPRAFDRTGTVSSQRYYGTVGDRLSVDMAGINNTLPITKVVQPASGSQSTNYYATVSGRQYPRAFNGLNFLSGDRPRSVILTQPY